MSDTPAATSAAPLGDLFATTAGGQAARSFGWSAQARSLAGLHGLLRGSLFLFIAAHIAMTLVLIVLLWVFSVWATPGGIENQMASTVAVTLDR